MYKETFIYDIKGRRKFVGMLNTDLIGREEYPFMEVPEQLRDKIVTLNTETGELVEDHQTTYNNKINLQLFCFEEYENQAFKNIKRVELMNDTELAQEYTQEYLTEKSAVENRIISINKGEE